MGKKIFTILRSKIVFIRIYGQSTDALNKNVHSQVPLLYRPAPFMDNIYVSKEEATILFKELSPSKALVPGLEVIKLEYSLKLKIKGNDWLLVDTCPQAANHCALLGHINHCALFGHVSTSSKSLRFILSLRMNSSSITSRPGELHPRVLTE